MPIQVDNAPLKIKLITDPGELEMYSDLLTRLHYLESSQVNRNTIMHVAMRGRDEVAVLTWERNVRRWFGMRDRLIGWTKSQGEQRCNYCIENRRFLMLCDEKNLASQVLSESMKRIGEDAKLAYGHDVMLAETFVDVSRGLQGTCYRAQGWTEVGLTQGGRGRKQRSQKLYFVKELKVDALAKLKAPELAPSDTSNPRQKVLSLQQLNLTSLRKKLDVIPDYRKHKGWYPMTSIYALLIVAVLSGETTAKGIWRWISGLSHEYLKSLGCRQAPSYSKVWNTLGKLDHNALQAAMCSWLTEQTDKVHLDKNIKILSIDGKALKSASKAADSDLHVLTLIDSITKVIRAQRPVGEKTNEIPVAQELLKQHPLDASMIITADAMHTQDNLAEVIQKKNAHYIFPVKDNQLNLKKAIIEETPDDEWSAPYTTTELAHGRLETRKIRVASVAAGELGFTGARSIAIVDRFIEYKKTGKSSHEQIPLVSSLVDPTPELLLRANRAHWTIETSVFGVRDVTYREDKCTMRKNNGPWNMTLLRSVAIGVSSLMGFKCFQDALSCFRNHANDILGYFIVSNRLHPI